MYAHEREALARRSRQAQARYPTRGSAALAPESSPAASGSPDPVRLPGQRTRQRAGSRPGAGRQRAAARVTGAEQARDQLTVAPPAPVAVPRTAFVVLVLVVVAAGVIGILLLNTKVNENAFILYDLTQAQAELNQREQELEQQIAQASSPAQLAESARRMGLVQAEQVAYLRLPDGEVLHEPVPGVTVPAAGAGAEG